jgi:hypothetical protein
MEIQQTASRLARPRIVALLLAAFCAVALHQSVYDDFEHQRLRVVSGRRADSQGTVTIQFPDFSQLAGQPVALVLRLVNESPATRIVRVAVGDSTATDVLIPGNGATRADLSLQTDGLSSVGQSLTLSSDGSEWLLTFLEIANIHGFSRGLVEFVVTPASATASDRPGALRSLTVFAVLLLLPGIPGSIFTNRYVRLVHRALASFFLLFLVTVLVAPWLSDFALLIAGHTFVLCMAVIYAPVLTRVARIVIRVATETPAWMRAHVWPRRVLLLYVAALWLFVTSIAALYDPEHGMTILIRFGGDLEEPVLPSVRAIPRYVVEDSFGYDGQFYAQMAVDPFLRDPALGEALDSPAYRARRILFSWTAYLLGLGQASWVVQAYAIQYVVYWLLLAWVLCRWFPPTNLRNLGRWFGCMFGHGAIISVVAALPDGPSMLLLALSVVAIEAGHVRRSAGLIGIAGLAKDVNLFWSPMLLVPGSLKRTGWRGLWVWGLLVTGPLFLWMLYVAGQFDMVGIGGGRNFAAPLASYFENWGVTLAALRDEGWESYARFSLCVMIGLTIQTAVLLIVRDWRSPWWRAGMGSVLLMVVLGPAVWEGLPGAVTRVLLPMTFAFNVVLPGNRWFWPLWVLGNLSIIPALEVLRVPFWYYV